ncbi:hypothetical protein KSS87_020183 [Heliosperma pusillum]|nr:hypothetical protein KSS87_020183 [Heliosperma pusillum]
MYSSLITYRTNLEKSHLTAICAYCYYHFGVACALKQKHGWAEMRNKELMNQVHKYLGGNDTVKTT